MDHEKTKLARQTLIVMQLDVGYHRDYTPHYNRDPIRHQLAWMYAVDVIGEDQIPWITAEERVECVGVACLEDL